MPHRTLQTLTVGGEPIRLLEYHPGRIKAMIILDSYSQYGEIAFAQTVNGLSTAARVLTYYFPIEIWGPDELWCIDRQGSGSTSVIFVQCLFE